ncbi:MAG: DUF1853 family protein [Pseudomonadota bacterium]
MPDAPDIAGAAFQARFEHAWGHLTRPRVRALAWLLYAPDLLDPHSAHWHGRIATLNDIGAGTAAWLAALEHDPAPLDAALGTRFYSRLGLYAEKLMAFYFEQHGILAAHGLQVRASRNDTVGEFDFLLRDGERLLHWEFATKFYLLDDTATVGHFNNLIGPNLADTLGVKMRKIFAHQLELSRHPAAQPLLPQAVDLAQALVKGWLFYPAGAPPALDGITPGHCHGYWATLAEFEAGQASRHGAARYVVMPRMQWLAPLKVRAAVDDAPAPGEGGDAQAAAPCGGCHVYDGEQLAALLRSRFELDAAPVMVASVRELGGWLVEVERGFLVVDDWRTQAAERRAAGRLPP